MKRLMVRKAKSGEQFEELLRKLPTGWSTGDREFSIQVAAFVGQRLLAIEQGLAGLAALQKIRQHPAYNGHKTRPSAWQQFFGAGMKAGKSPAEIGAEWRAQKRGSTS